MSNNIIKTIRNGKVIDTVIATDRSLLYGDGIFTTIAIKQGKAQFLQDHFDRLDRDARQLKIDNIPLQKIKTSLLKLIHDTEHAIVRVSISRGCGERGYRQHNSSPVFWLTLSPWPSSNENFNKEGINLRICQQRLSHNPALAGIKHCNRLEQVLARNEWQDEQFQEGLMLDYHDHVLEGTMSNLFIVKNGHIVTPDLTFAGVKGIIRQRIIDLSNKLSIPLSISNLTIEDVISADTLFITNSVIGIWPVKQLNDQTYKKNPIIGQLADELNKQMSG